MLKNREDIKDKNEVAIAKINEFKEAKEERFK